MRPWGWLLLLAVLKWRRPEARWLLVSALLPGNPQVYDALPLLFFLPSSFRQALLLALLSHVADLWGYWLEHGTSVPIHLSEAHVTALLWALYVPALVLLLCKPNRDFDRSPNVSSAIPASEHDGR
jgi:hypothetical protein